MIQSAIAGNEVLQEYVPRQMIYVVAGIGVIIVTALINYQMWASLTRLMYVIVLAFLMIVFVVGKTLFGAARWLDVGLVLIQPAEVAKIVIILALADYFARNSDQPKDLKWILGSFILVAGLVIWILLQPNLSMSIVIFVIWFSLLWISGLPPKYIALFVLVAIVAVVILFPFLQTYQQQRVINFIFPDPNARHGDTYNVDQALISIGSGGWMGQGYGQGTQVQLRFLKVRHTDFIFSAMAEEFGFIGTVIVVALLIFVIIRCIRAARLASDMFGALVAYGFATLIFFQTAVNIGVNLRLLPVTGLTLPFISYGGSSISSLFLGIGLVESVVARRNS